MTRQRDIGRVLDAWLAPGPIEAPDRVLDILADECFAGEMASCDGLYQEAEVGSDYETYGDTCAGRQDAGTGQFCTEAFP